MMDTTDAGLERLFQSSTIRPEHLREVQEAATLILAHEDQYRAVSELASIPWTVIGILHCLESDCDFQTHLHNGDPLTARTIHVPKGRPFEDPQSGHLPYSWEESAEDALSDVWLPQSWTIGGMLQFCRHYNGIGNESHGVNSPYVWSYTTAYTKGRFIRDHVFDPEAVSKEPGAAAILKILLAG
jgi:lysozyme family protein